MRKKSMFKKLLSGVLAAALAATALISAPISAGAVSGEDQSFEDLDQYEIVEAMAPGWNLGNQLEASINGKPGETSWGNPTITKDTIKMVKDAGFKSVRIPVSYLDYIGDKDSGYEIRSSWLDRVQQVVDYCMELDMYAIINIHGDGYTTVYNGWLMSRPETSGRNGVKPEPYTAEEQLEVNKKFELVWKQIATRFKNYDEHLIFESMNEVFDGSYSAPDEEKYAQINTYNQIFVDTVRKTSTNNSKRWLLIPGWNTDINYTAGNYGFKIPTDTNRDSSIPANEQRIMISVHYYNPWDFCGEGKFSKTEWGTDDEIKALTDNFDLCYSKFVNKGYPVIIGECGAVDQNNIDSRVKWISTVCKTARSRGMVPVYWDNNGHGTGPDKFGLFDRTTKKVTQPEMIKAIMDAYVGEPDPAPVIIDPITKDEALAVIYSTNAAGAQTLVNTTADASMNGATTVRVYFDTASDVSFNQYANIVISSDVAGTASKATVAGDSDITGATNLSADLTLKSAISTGDSVSVAAYTASWKNASDYAYLIRQVDFLDADGNVLKTVKKSEGLLGDVNGDGDITTADVGLANAQAKGTGNLTDDQFARADIDGNGEITTSDVGRINSHAKGVNLLW